MATHPTPPQLDAAQAQLLTAIEGVDKKKIDALKTPWAEIEGSVIKLLKGAFAMERPDHQAIALGLASILGARLAHDHQAFWFPNRESMEGAALGFPEALIMLSPLGAVAEALATAKLSKLEDVSKDIRNSLAQVKFGGPGAPGRLSPLDYQRLFDPGFVQFVALDSQRAKGAWNSTPDKLAREVRDAVGRTGSALPPEVKQQLEAQIVQSLQRLDPKASLIAQVDRAPRVAELIGHLFATTANSGSAPEEFWQDVVMALLHIGVPASLPPLDPEEIEVAKQGADPLYLFLDVVPYQVPAPEEGLLGAFALDELTLPDPGFSQVGSLRLIQVNRSRVKPLLDKFDGAKTREALAKFQAHVEKAAGKPVPPTEEGKQLLDAALALLGDLKKASDAGGELCLRRTTEAEASSEAALSVVRGALQGPRIILAP